MKIIFLFVILILLTVTTAYAQEEPGVNCFPIQGQGWSGCVPNYQAQPKQPQSRQAPQSLWVDHYGAIATDEPRGAMGASTDMSSRDSAESAALASCKAKGGINCTVQISYGNQCVAMVIGGKIFNVNSGATIDKAVEKGMKMCGAAASDCHAYYTACSLPIRIQ